MSIKAVIFDLDGTITQPFFDFDAIRRQMGLPKDAGPIWEAMAKMDPEKRQRAEDILDYHETNAVEQSALNPGAAETLASLRKAGIFIGVLTRNRKDNAFAVAQKHNIKFDAVVGREDGPVKPDSFGVLQLCNQFGVAPAEAMLVGDYLFDLLCAKSAGSVAVLLANTPKAKQFAAEADFTIDRIDQVIDIIEQKVSEVIE